MRYRGDGSYKPDDYDLETSLMDLLSAEAESVDRINTSIRAYDKAKKSGMKTFEYIKDIEDAKKETENIRVSIANYFKNKLKIER